MIELLRLFGKEIKGCDKLVDFATVNKQSLIKGYLVTTDACTSDVIDYLDTISINPNATFYKDWKDVISKDRFELFIDQIKHYASTYGTNFTEEAYVPNDGAENLPPMDNIKIIDTISKSEAIEKLEKMIYSPMAMAQETVNDILSLTKKLSIKVDIEKVSNKELKMLLCDTLGIVPLNAEEFIRFLIYKATGKTLLIKSKEVIKEITNSGIQLSKYITKENIDNISSVFYRFKPIFLAFKHCNKENAKTVNALRKLAIKFHQPKRESFWANCFSHSLPEILKKADELNNFKKISLINECFSKIHENGTIAKPYLIRNGKMFVTEHTNSYKNEKIRGIASILTDSLLKSLKSKACKVKLDKNVELALPTSEKTFIGNYPIYSSIAMDNDTIVGIYWRENWGARDLDLSYIDSGGHAKIGWNANFTNNNVVFSGDMTSANPEATELLYFKKKIDSNDSGIIHVNNFSGKDNSEYNLFVAKEKIAMNNWKTGYMCDPNNIIFQSRDKMDSKEKSIAIIANSKLYIASLRTGSKIVSSSNKYTTQYADYIKDNIKNHLTLSEVLCSAGFEIVDKSEDADMDFSNPTKDMFMNLLS